MDDWIKVDEWTCPNTSCHVQYYVADLLGRLFLAKHTLSGWSVFEAKNTRFEGMKYNLDTFEEAKNFAEDLVVYDYTHPKFADIFPASGVMPECNLVPGSGILPWLLGSIGVQK